MAKSNNRMVLKSIIVVREGRRVSPPIGKSFPFNDEELEALKRNPTATRAAVNEDEEADLAEVIALSQTNTRVINKRVLNGAGKTTGMVDGMDGTITSGEQGSDADSKPLTIDQIKVGVAELGDEALDAALAAEIAGGNRAGAVTVYKAEIARRKPSDDDL